MSDRNNDFGCLSGLILAGVVITLLLGLVKACSQSQPKGSKHRPTTESYSTNTVSAPPRGVISPSTKPKGIIRTCHTCNGLGTVVRTHRFYGTVNNDKCDICGRTDPHEHYEKEVCLTCYGSGKVEEVNGVVLRVLE